VISRMISVIGIGFVALTACGTKDQGGTQTGGNNTTGATGGRGSGGSGAGGTAGLALAEVYDASLADPSSRLVNISARAGVGIGAQKLIAGFVISGNTPKTVLLRAIGPGLAPYNVSGVISDPRLILFDAANHALEVNIGWHDSSALAQAFSQTGAFVLPAHSSDSAILVTLPPGSYTAQVDSASGATGTALVEVYEAP